MYNFIIYICIIIIFYCINKYIRLNEYFSGYVKNLELIDFKDKYKNQDIYIIGSGKSCDFLDNDFFNNKITIGVNQVYKKFKCNYYIRKENKHIDTVLKNINDSILFISRGNYGTNNNVNKDYFEKNKKYKNKVVIFDHYDNCGSVDNDNNIKKYNYNHLNKNNDKLISTSSTLLTAIHLAYYMGAKNIILVGHDCCRINGESNFKNYHTEKTLNIVWKNQDEYNNWLSKIESQTVYIKNILKNNYNVNVVSLNPFVSYNLEGNIKN